MRMVALMLRNFGMRMNYGNNLLSLFEKHGHKANNTIIQVQKYDRSMTVSVFSREFVPK